MSYEIKIVGRRVEFPPEVGSVVGLGSPQDVDRFRLKIGHSIIFAEAAFNTAADDANECRRPADMSGMRTTLMQTGENWRVLRVIQRSLKQAHIDKT